QIQEALPLVEESLRGNPRPYAIQAAIASLHCRAGRPEETDWPQILSLYDLLERMQPSPIVSLNRAVAVAMVHGSRPAPVTWTAITCCIPRAPICCGASALHKKRRKATRRHWRSSPMIVSAGFSNAGFAKFRPERPRTDPRMLCSSP